MIYVTGDIHGTVDKLEYYCEEYNTTKDDIIIILGDTGFNYYLNKKDDILKQYVSELPCTFFCIRGNHEARPGNIDTYHIETMFGNDVYIEDAYPNIIFAKDGGIYDFEHKKVLCIGGAYSVDKQYRIARGWMWFADEQLTEDEMKLIASNVIKYTEFANIDYILTHTCPYNTRPTHMFLPGINQDTVDNTMEKWMQGIADNIDFQRWYFGHFHGDWNNYKYTMLYNGIVPLGERYEK